jgi:molybdopterin converting factor small subunit
LFALARQRVGRGDVTLELAGPVTVEALKRELGVTYPELAPLLPHVLIAVAGEYAADDMVIPPGAEIAAIPPVSGGSGAHRPRRHPSLLQAIEAER